MTAQPLWILHLSDLHFGPHSRFAGEDVRRLVRLHLQALDEARPALGAGVDERVRLVIITGDIAEAARPREYEEARAFFTLLAGELGLAPRYVVFVPGNHDVSWNATKKVVLEQDDEGFGNAERDRRILEVKLKSYERFLEGFYGNDEQRRVQALGHGAFVHSFPELRVAVAALNSCERESHLVQGGHLGAAQAQALMGQWQSGEVMSWLKIIAIHHNPVATVPVNVKHWLEYLKAKKGELKDETLGHFMADTYGFEGWERLRAVAEDCGVSVVLHGHHHASGADPWAWKKAKAKGQTLVLSAGSWGLKEDALPEGQPAMMHLLRLDAGEQEARSVLRMYERRARAAGEVEEGHFAVDAAQPEGVRLALCVPEGLRGEAGAATGKGEGERERDGKQRDFVAAYRATLVGNYQQWQLRGVGVQPGGAARPVEATLDEMYLPLRLLGEGEQRRSGAEGEEKQEAGRVIDPAEVIARTAPMVIRGPAGSGKTTWMKWTFRRLLGMEGALPFMIELRKLAADWEKARPRAGDRTLEAYLTAWVAEAGLGGWAGAVRQVLASNAGPRPVVLVDGWDELGDLGHEIREKLQHLVRHFPRVLVVVSSRPYGESRPTRSEGFEVFDVQPLSDVEIAAQAERFHARVHGEDEGAAKASATRFLAALEVSPEARELARTALLLTMMLLLSRNRPLPDKRHKLYEQCMESLLSALPQLREEEGAQQPRDAWAPEDSEERLRVVAKLAFEMQTVGYAKQNRQPIVRSWDELERMLPGTWRTEDRRRFLVWLVAWAGVMVDRADGKLMFTHLSFQEYLTARHMAATLEGAEARIDACRERMGDVDWWETLRLWAAIIDGRNPEHLAPVLKALVTGEATGFWLVGAMLTDGISEAIFDLWCIELSRRFHVDEVRYLKRAARAWAGSRQSERRARIAALWPDVERGLRWLPVAVAEGWWDDARLRSPGTQSTFVQLLDGSEERRCIAVGRALTGSSPFWPGVSEQPLLLRLWPVRRGPAGMRLQTLLSLGGGDWLNVVAQRALVVPRTETKRALYLSRRLAIDLDPYWPSALAIDIARYLLSHMDNYIDRDLVVDWMRYWSSSMARHWSRALAWNQSRDITSAQVRLWSTYLARDYSPRLGRELLHQWSLPEAEPWAVDFAGVELASLGRAGTRAILASTVLPANPLIHLFQLACRLSLHPSSDPTPFQQALTALPPDTDPLWPALARHITRRSTPEDRALLEDLARHPEKRDPPLRWGLQYYVRGDLVLDDGTEILLDDLCDQLNLPRLPYLEDLPDELAVDFDAPDEPPRPPRRR